MTTTQTILAILSSSVLSSILTSYFNWRIHNSNYKKDYYKKILDKRLDAYESLNILINRLSDLVYTDNSVIHGIVSNEESFDFFISTLHSTMQKSYWLSDKTGHKLTEFGTFLFNNITGHIDESVSKEVIERKYNELALANYESINKFKLSLKQMANFDLKNLYDVDNFFDKNGKDSTTYPLYEKEIYKKGL